MAKKKSAPAKSSPKKGKIKRLNIEDLEDVKGGGSEPAEKGDRSCKPNCKSSVRYKQF